MQNPRIPSSNDSTTSDSASVTSSEEPSFEFADPSQLPPSEPSGNVLPVPDKTILPVYTNMRKKQLEYNDKGSLILSEENIKLLCIKEGLYEYPELNNKLYLHFKNIEKIEGLEHYINLKTLYLENNVIRKIENIGHLKQLENLFLQHNMIETMEGLENNTNLIVLNLSHNNIFKIEGLSSLQKLQNLSLSHNQLSDFESLEGLGQCGPSLTAIDLSYNRIEADIKIVDLIPQVKCLYLSGNPLVKSTLHYRRTLVSLLNNLMYLDDRAVSEEEKYMAQEWKLGGDEGFKKARQIVQEKNAKIQQERKEEVMKDINVHRNKKINIFKNSIKELQEEISRLQELISDPINLDMSNYYINSIEEKENKISELQEFIESLEARIEGREPRRAKGEKGEEGEGMVRLEVREVGEQEGEQEEGGEGKENCEGVGVGNEVGKEKGVGDKQEIKEKKTEVKSSYYDELD